MTILGVIAIGVNAYRTTRDVSWRQATQEIIRWLLWVAVIYVPVVVIAAYVAPRWATLRPIAVVVGLYGGLLLGALVVLYLVVRVVRFAWKGD